VGATAVTGITTVVAPLLPTLRIAKRSVGGVGSFGFSTNGVAPASDNIVTMRRPGGGDLDVYGDGGREIAPPQRGPALQGAAGLRSGTFSCFMRALKTLAMNPSFSIAAMAAVRRSASAACFLFRMMYSGSETQ
jgi:hypothetical protein